MARLPKNPLPDDRPLTERELQFVRALPTMTPPQAAESAGYADPAEAKRLMARPEVVLALLAELQRREVKLSVLRVQAKGTLSAAMTCPLGVKEGGPHWSERVNAAKTVLDVLKKEGKTLAEAAEDEDLAEATVAIAKRMLSEKVGEA